MKDVKVQEKESCMHLEFKNFNHDHSIKVLTVLLVHLNLLQDIGNKVSRGRKGSMAFPGSTSVTHGYTHIVPRPSFDNFL